MKNSSALENPSALKNLNVFMKKSECLGENLNALCKIQVPCEKSKCLVKKFKCLKNLNAL